jgi:NAD+ synthase (glutamine-hydrolysing)
VINASPYTVEKPALRRNAVQLIASRYRKPVVYVNAVGGQDELVFDGGSFVMDRNGRVLFGLKDFQEDYGVWHGGNVRGRRTLEVQEARAKVVITQGAGATTQALLAAAEADQNSEEKSVPERAQLTETLRISGIYRACVLGLRDYAQKNGFVSYVLGLSGGIDSAVVATMAADALGGENVYGISMPSQFSSLGSKKDALKLAQNLGLQFSTQPIKKLLNAYIANLEANGLELSSVAQENIQARIRGNILMAYSNSSEETMLVLATGNKSELAVGYSTIYGDAVGGFAPIKDVYKTDVWKLARWRNNLSLEELAQYEFDVESPIPEKSITKPPSAELRPDQVDQDTLPSYEELDTILRALIEDEKKEVSKLIPPYGMQTAQAQAVSAEKARKVQEMLQNAEWKRKQYPVGPKVSAVAFGKDWRMPISAEWSWRVD